jgi:cytochrome oxidase Cu insertion factor (SCO1/SenC/PrrC family)
VKVGSVLLFLGLLGLSVPTEQKMPSGNSAVAPPIGLEIGQHAPAFTKSDQFGTKQSNETLKGSKGTILLFFRSADW